MCRDEGGQVTHKSEGRDLTGVGRRLGSVCPDGRRERTSGHPPDRGLLDPLDDGGETAHTYEVMDGQGLSERSGSSTPTVNPHGTLGGLPIYSGSKP